MFLFFQKLFVSFDPWPILATCENDVILRGPLDKLNLFPTDGLIAVFVSNGLSPGKFLLREDSDRPCGLTVAGALVVWNKASGRLNPEKDFVPRFNLRVSENFDSGRLIRPL